jgi:hypothetical protein
MIKTQDLVCYYCLSSRCDLRTDRRGRPYTRCASCGARAFLVSWRDAIRTLALVQPLVAACAEEIETDRDAATAAGAREAQVGAAMRALFQARPDTPAATGAPIEGAYASGSGR